MLGLQTRAEDKGDHFLVNGQKVWTSNADKADWIYALVRTDNSVKHAGITMVMFDMESEGVSTRPIKLISGSSPFCETFFDDVKVSKSQVVGARSMVAGRSPIACCSLSEKIFPRVRFAAEMPLDLGELTKTYLGEEAWRHYRSHRIRNNLSRLKMREKVLGLTVKRIMEEAKAGSSTGAASSIIKFLGAELNKDRYEYFLEIMGQQGLGWEGEGFSELELQTCRQWLRSKANSIEGGTTEINSERGSQACAWPWLEGADHE